ncbi:hypothetical protein GC207_13545 [bacterium]|nr:hypothetical protein [bacterium]
MSNPINRRLAWRAGAGVAGLLILLAIAWKTQAQSPPTPGLTITQTSTNQFSVKVTNGVSYANYELYRTPVLGDPAFPWTLHLIGSLGQTNFTVLMDVTKAGFVQASVGLDWDGDGVDNWQDAQPSSTNAGLLTITIDSPANGSTIN